MSLMQLASQFSNGMFLLMILAVPVWGLCHKVDIYSCFIEGAKDGLNITLQVFPHLLAMLVAIGMLRASGAFNNLSHLLAPLLAKIGMPPDVLPLALIRPFSGSAANGFLAELINSHGGNSYISKLAATMMGSTETTFYVVAVYFGAINIQRTRHAIPCGLFAELIAIFAAIWICSRVFM